MRDEKEEDLRKRLWGDNSAAISLATGEGQGSWRTRHLRIRASILRAALHQGEWQLGHLNGKELVADSFTKVVDGQAFERALQDLCVGTTKSKNLGEGGVRSDMINAKIAMLVGSTLLSTAKASDGMEKDDDMFWLWTCGLILMCVGAVYVCSKAYRSGVRLYKRLSGASGDHSGPKVKEHGTEPQLKMLRLSSSEEESDEGVQRRTDLRARQRAQPVDMDELRTMVSQSRAAIGDPYNKMHGREAQNWLSDDEDPEPRKFRLHTGDQLPKRKKKKNKNKRASGEDDDAAVERAWQSMLQTTSYLYGASSSRQSRPQSGSSSAVVDDSYRMRPQSGSSSAVVDDSYRMRPQSGSSSAVVDDSYRMRPQSGSSSAVVDDSYRMRPQSGSSSAVVDDSYRMRPQSGSSSAVVDDSYRMRPQSGSSSAVVDDSYRMRPQSGSSSAVVEDSCRMRPPSGSSGAVVDESRRMRPPSGFSKAAAEKVSPQNPWNEFQQEMSGRRWTQDKVRAGYWKFKSTGKKPV